MRDTSTSLRASFAMFQDKLILLKDSQYSVICLTIVRRIYTLQMYLQVLCVDTGFQLDTRSFPGLPQQAGTEAINIYKQSTEVTLILRFLMMDGVVFGFTSPYSYLPLFILSPAYQV